MKYKWLFIILFASCRGNTNATMSSEELALVKDSVTAMIDHITDDLSTKGPVAWLDYFEDGPDFNMASDGALVFKNYQTASNFIRDTLVNMFARINLRWEHLRIDPLTNHLASIASDFHEDLIDSTGKSITTNGYITAIAEKTSCCWQLRNVHWSILKPQ